MEHAVEIRGLVKTFGQFRGRARSAHLRLESIPPTRAASALLVASALGIRPAVSLIALAALPAHAARYGFGPALVAAGVAGGAAAWWGATWAATERLTRRGPEVLAAAGRTTAAPTAEIPLTWDADGIRSHPTTIRALTSLTLGWISVVPQVLVLTGLLLGDRREPA